MADEVLNLRIDQLQLGVPNSGDFGIYRDMTALKTKRYLIPSLQITQNFEWSPADNYLTGESVTYGGGWWQSQDDDNTGVVPGTNPAKWLAIAKGSAGTWWTAGAYPEDKPWVLSNHNGYPEIMVLRSATRPYNSVDIADEEALGDWISMTQLLKDKQIDSSGAVSVLDFLYASKKAFILDTPIGAAHEIQLLNDEDSKEFEILLQVSAVPAPITFPVGFQMPDALFEGGNWSPLDIGTYYGRGVKLNDIWILKLERLNA